MTWGALGVFWSSRKTKTTRSKKTVNHSGPTTLTLHFSPSLTVSPRVYIYSIPNKTSVPREDTRLQCPISVSQKQLLSRADVFIFIVAPQRSLSCRCPDCRVSFRNHCQVSRSQQFGRLFVIQCCFLAVNWLWLLFLGGVLAACFFCVFLQFLFLLFRKTCPFLFGEQEHCRNQKMALFIAPNARSSSFAHDGCLSTKKRFSTRSSILYGNCVICQEQVWYFWAERWEGITNILNEFRKNITCLAVSHKLSETHLAPCLDYLQSQKESSSAEKNAWLMEYEREEALIWTFSSCVG